MLSMLKDKMKQNYSALNQRKPSTAGAGDRGDLGGAGSPFKTPNAKKFGTANTRFLQLPGSPGRGHKTSYSMSGSKFNVPENANQLFGQYYGQYSKLYAPSFDGTFKNRSTAAGTLMPGTTTREPNNQKGKDANFDEVTSYIHSPVKFERQRKREIFHKRDGCMVGNANENRFVAF